jgi:hypothetical protein
MASTDANVSENADMFPCPLCGEQLSASATECTKCDWVKGYRHPETIDSYNARDVIACAISLVPGAGHLYKGHVKAGIAFFIGAAIIVFFIGLVGMVGMGFQILLIPFYWVWVMIQAFFIKDLNTHTVPAHID